MPLQKTLKSSVSLTGVGLHTGAKVTVTLSPAPENYGIRLIRTDIAGEPEVVADIDNVVDLHRGTSIGKGEVKIHTLEHLMAAFAGLQIDNCKVFLDGPEIPLMDGSSLPHVEAIERAGIETQQAVREYITVDEPIVYVDGDIALGVFPSEHFRITCAVDYHHPALGAQYTTMFSLKDFVSDFASSRTFCFLSEIEKLREAGLIKGGSLNAALVVQDIDLSSDHISYIQKLFNEHGPIVQGTNGFLNNQQQRYPNEPCRHKALDLLGDLYLLGKPIQAHILASRPGHRANHEMAKLIRSSLIQQEKKKANSQKPVYDIADIMKYLPHRYPFLLVDKVIECEQGKKIVAIKNVTINEPFFQGHFPDNPVMPGVLQIEAMAQAGGLMALEELGGAGNGTILFMGIDKCRFRDMVRPGDTMKIVCEMLQKRRGTIRFSGTCFVEGKIVAQAELMAMLRPNQQD